MEKIKGYWVDDNNNKWSAKKWTKDQAEELSYKLIDCENCTNCVDCENCRWCKFCVKCKNCEQCNGINEVIA